MVTNGARGVERAWGPAVPGCPEEASCLRSAPRRVATGRETRVIFARGLVLFAACLAGGIVAIMVLETFGLDPDLRPFGTDDFTVALQQAFEGGLQSVPLCSGLAAILWFVATPGARLILSHRARSALATDRPTLPMAFNMAEPWWSYPIHPPGLGHSFSGDPTETWNLRERARAADAGPLPCALPIIGRFSSQVDFSLFREAGMLSDPAGAPTPSEMSVTLAGDGVRCRVGSGDSIRRVAWTSTGGRP
jgi:hypothetical protein